MLLLLEMTLPACKLFILFAVDEQLKRLSLSVFGRLTKERPVCHRRDLNAAATTHRIKFYSVGEQH
jgi:hypothetical protein